MAAAGSTTNGKPLPADVLKRVMNACQANRPDPNAERRLRVPMPCDTASVDAIASFERGRLTLCRRCSIWRRQRSG